MSSQTHPKFLRTPYELVADKRVKPMDERIYGVVHWYAKMKKKRCSASNDTLAEVAKTTAHVVQNSLARLEKLGYVKRTYKDDSRRVRDEIIPLIGEENVSPTDDTHGGDVSSADDGVPPTDDTYVSSADDQNKNKSIKNNKEERRNPKSKRVLFSPKDLELANRLYERIPENITIKEPNLEQWADHIRLMRERDGFDEQQIAFLIDWAQDNNFWRANILSTQKLREKSDTLIAQIKRDQDMSQEKKQKHKVAFV